MNRSRLLFASGLGAVCCLVAAGCQQQPPADVVREAARQEAKKARSHLDELGSGNVKVQGSTLRGSDGKGHALWSVQFKEGLMTTVAGELQPRRYSLIGAGVTLFRDGKPESSFRSDRIEMVGAERNPRLTLKGNVRAQTAGPWVGPRGAVILETPVVEIDVKARQVWTKQKVRITQGAGRAQTVVTARQLTADTSLTQARLRGDVRATSAEGAVSADEAVWNWKDGQAQATGHITASHEGTTITGERLVANTTAGRGTLSGGVRAAAPQGRATAASVQYNWKDGTLSARGGVTLSKNDASLRAARIDTDDKLRRASATGGVVLTRDDATLRAARIDAGDGFQNATASGGVTLSKDGATLRADRIAARDKFQKATATGDVSLSKDDATLHAARIDADNASGQATASGGVTLRKGDVTLHAGRVDTFDRMARAVASGRVKVTRSDMTITAARAEATGIGKKGAAYIVATGDVVLTSDKGATLRASSVRYDEKGNRVYASGGVTLHEPQRGVRQQSKTLVAKLVNGKLSEVVVTEGTVTLKGGLFGNKKLF